MTQHIARIAWAIFALLAGIYLLTASGHTYAIDEELLFGVTESLALRGNFALNNPAATGEPPIYSLYGPGQSLAAVPLYHLGRALALLFPPHAYGWVTRAIVLWFNPFVTAGIAALIYLAAIYTGYGQRAAMGTALLFGLATTALPHSRTFFSEALTSFFLFAAFVAVLAALHTRRAALVSPGAPAAPWASRRVLLMLGLAGALAGLTPAVRVSSAIGVPLLGLHLLLAVLWVYRSGGNRWLSPDVRSVLPPLLAWGVGAGLTVGLLALFQWLYYGSPVESGYGNNALVFQHLFRNNVWRGLYGLVLSPGKGILVYAPCLLLLPVAAGLCWRRTWDVALVCSLMVGAHLLLYARFNFWHGDGAWGPRYLITVLPFMVLPLVAYLDRLGGWRTPLQSGVLLVLLLLTVPVQIGGLAINFNIYFMQSKGATRYYQPRHSPVVHHLEVIANQLRTMYMQQVAGNSVVLLDGFAYSEGDRSRGQQVPRWTQPHAAIALRPPPAETLRLTLALSGCRPPPVPPGQVALGLDTQVFVTDTPCPPRTYHLLLPARTATLSLDATAWEPQAARIEREDGPLGVKLLNLTAQADGQVVPVRGALVPIMPLPPGTGPVTIREWVNDYRYGHWDFWWWYLAHSGFPAGPAVVLAGVWLGLGCGLTGWGGGRLWQVFRSSG